MPPAAEPVFAPIDEAEPAFTPFPPALPPSGVLALPAPIPPPPGMPIDPVEPPGPPITPPPAAPAPMPPAAPPPMPPAAPAPPAPPAAPCARTGVAAASVSTMASVWMRMKFSWDDEAMRRLHAQGKWVSAWNDHEASGNARRSGDPCAPWRARRLRSKTVEGRRKGDERTRSTGVLVNGTITFEKGPASLVRRRSGSASAAARPSRPGSAPARPPGPASCSRGPTRCRSGCPRRPAPASCAACR